MATLIIRGLGSPEGFIEAKMGSFYINTQSSSVYAKVRGDATTNKGWKVVNAKGYYEGSGSPEGVIPANKYAMYFDNSSENLYMQTQYGSPLSTIGWIPVNLGDEKNNAGDPNAIEYEGVKGDIYVDDETFNIYLHTEEIWERIPLMDSDSTDILLKLSELLTNSTGIVSQYFNMFFNPNPMDIELAQYDNDGILKVYKIPNRAKDSIALLGEGAPEGVVSASRGQMYLDVTTGIPYIKKTLISETEGWEPLKIPDALAPLYYLEATNELGVNIDEVPTEFSQALLKSGTIYEELNKIRNGSMYEVFAVADPVELYHATPRSYVDDAMYGLFSYDASTRTLSVNAPLNQDITESATICSQEGQFFTPRLGSAYSTDFTFTQPWKEPEGNTILMYSPVPCQMVVTCEPYADIIDNEPVIVQFDYNVEFTATEKYQRPFTDDMKAGIKKIKVVASTEYDYPTVSIVKNIYKQFTSEVIPNEGE